MRFSLLSFLLFFICITESAGQKNKVLIYELDNINGLFFVPNHVEPFTGTAYNEFPGGKKQISLGIKNGKPHGISREWARNGTKVYETRFEDGIQNGTEKQWYVTGAIKLEIPYLNGKAHGICTEWHKNGQKKSEGRFTEGREEGEHNWWYNTGEFDQQATYQNGLSEGIVKNWHKNGTLSLESHYKTGKKEGRTRAWYKNGQLRREELYKNDQKHGISNYFASSGQLTGIQEHKNGELVRDENYRSGSIRSEKGFMQVFNDKESFFMIHLAGNDISPRRADVPTFVIDGDMLQLYTKSIAAFSGEPAQDEEKTLRQSIDHEVTFIRKMTVAEIVPVINFGVNAKGQHFAHWYFRSPAADDEKQKARTVQEEHYISFVCNKKILSLYSVVTNSDTRDEIKNLLEKQSDHLEVKPEKIELNALARKLQTGL